jgi:inhibitor of KinA sporulation pathway (predicted exonuclease)
MTKNKDSYYLIIDLEATCCDNNSIPSREMEIIEIGAVMLNSNTWEIESEFQKFIQPIIHPKLTEFCRKLTTITQADVDGAIKFPEAMANLTDWMQEYPRNIFCSWGNYDKKQFQQDCNYHQIDYPFGTSHINIKEKFSEFIGTSKGYGMAKALEYLGFELKGIHHRGIDDAHNIARIYRHIKTTNKSL